MSQPIAITEAAHRNHKELFPNHISPLKVTDPELSILIALGGVESQIKGHIQGNLKVGNGRDVLLDVMTQLLPWVGYPSTLNALSAVNEVPPER